MKYEKGHKKQGGREKGTANKLTASFKELVTKAYQTLEDKKDKGLVNWAIKNETDFYKIASKLIPTELQNQIDGELLIKVIREGDNTKTT